MGADATSSRPRVTAFFDFACPICYIERPRLLRLRREHDVTLDFIPFELRPAMPARQRPEDAGATHSDRVEAYLDKVAAEEGLALVHPDFVPNTHNALALAELARDAGPEYYESLHAAIFDAYLGEGRDISDRDVLRAIAEAEGFDPAQVTQVWDERLYDERLESLRNYALEIGVVATPSAIVCDTLIIGSRPYGVLEQTLSACLAGEPVSDEDGEMLASVGEVASEPESDRGVARAAEG